MDIKEIRKLTGLSAQKFGDKYDIPLRTIQNWEGGVNTPPPYLVKLLERVVKEDIEEPKTGHWISIDDDFFCCSECGDSYYPRPIDAFWSYCPHCGAKMESEG